MSIPPISGIAAMPSLTPTPADSPQEVGTGFSDALQKLIGAVDSSDGQANQAIGNMLDGSGDVHEAMIAMQKADTMLQLTVQIRNKLVSAYQDIMRMPT
jgi:flagellar hook-basal body complex protein FliE